MKRLHVCLPFVLALLLLGSGAWVPARGAGGRDGVIPAKLVASDGLNADHFGTAVSVSGDTALVGSPYADIDGRSGQGAAYIYYRAEGGPGTWGQVAKLTASDGSAGSYFGISVSLDGDTALVGAIGRDAGGNQDQGAAYVFYRDQGGPGAWGQVAELTAADGGALDEFGQSVSLSGDTALIGAHYADVDGKQDQGAAYVFYRDQGGPDAWNQVAKLTAADGEASDAFGRHVAVSGDTALAGAVNADVGANLDQGAAYVFYRDQGGADAWGQVARVAAAGGEEGDAFGVVSIDGDTALVGACWANPYGHYDEGAVWVFYRDQGGADEWGEVTRLTASDGVPYSTFCAASIDGDRALIGAADAPVGGFGNVGAAYVFDRDLGGAGAWGQVFKLIAPDGLAADRFGSAVSIEDGTPLIGAEAADVYGSTDQGAAYVVPILDRRVYVPWLGRIFPPYAGAPTLLPIGNPEGCGSYGVSWGDAPRGDWYILQEDDNAAFTSPVELVNGWFNSYQVTGRDGGTYYYRVRSENSWGPGPWSNVESTTVNPGGWCLIHADDFEGNFPGPWVVVDNDGFANGEYYWAKRDCRRYSGSYSAWGVGGGANGSALACGANYPNSAEAWMVYGPFSLAGAEAADLTFNLRLTTELYHDGIYWLASVNNSYFYGTGASGDSSGWVTLSLDFSDVPDYGSMLGQSAVWVAFVFVSDSSGSLVEGAFVDDVVLRRHLGSREASGGPLAPELPSGMILEPVQRTLER